MILFEGECTCSSPPTSIVSDEAALIRPSCCVTSCNVAYARAGRPLERVAPPIMLGRKHVTILILRRENGDEDGRLPIASNDANIGLRYENIA